MGRGCERTDAGCIIGSTKDEFGSAVIARADVRHIRLAGDKDLCGAKVAEFEHTLGGIQQQILGLDVAMADADRVDVGQGAEELIHVQLDELWRHVLLELDVVTQGAVDGLRDILHHEVQVDLVFL